MNYAQMFGLFFIFIRNYSVMELKKHPIPKEIAPEHQELMTEIGNRIRKLRTDKGKLLIEMASDIKISRNEYSLLEKGKLYFKFSTLLRILDYHQIPFSNFTKSM